METILRDAWGVVSPLVILLVSTVGPVLVAWLSARLIGLMNIKDEEAKMKIEAQLREALHQSAANAIRYATARMGVGAAADELVKMALPYVQAKNPETLEKLGVDPGNLRDILLSKVPDVLATLRR